MFFVATEKHAPSVCQLVNSAYRGDSGRKGWTTESDYLDGQRIDENMFQEMLTSNSVILLFGPQNSPIGSVYVENKGNEAYIGMLTVSPTEQGKGIGKQILQQAEKYALQHWGLEIAKMTVISKRAELIAFYERRGYVDTGKREPFPYGQDEFGIPKTDDLEFIVMKKKLLFLEGERSA